ncbi:MAG: NAD(P)H-quinone oxidoreductase [Candidatus Schekmanbacteria bacterium]|nr:MAG: NAD(P)H-quinone oxidoreductase [Candidatus Schekmanbacteria bacterium]
MKCAVIKKFGKEIENLVIEEREGLKAEECNVKVKIAATALNRADLLQRRGLYPAPKDTVQDIPGLEFSGVVDEVGEDVTLWKGGERVFGIASGGTYAEEIVINEKLLMEIPDSLDLVEAAAVPEAFITAHDALRTQGNMSEGDIVLIHSAAGGVGSAAIQIVNLFSATAIGTVGSKEKIDKIKEYADFYAINYKESDFQELIESKFGKSSVAVILDTVGAPYWQKNLSLLKKKGRLIVVGVMGGVKAETNLSLILSKRLHIIGTVLRSRPLEEKIDAVQKFSKEVLPHFNEGKLKPVIDSIYPFEKLYEATRRMENNENSGKIILAFG